MGIEQIKFKKLQVVHLLINDTVEIGVITDSDTNPILRSQPTYTVTLLNDDFTLVSIKIEEGNIFSSYDELLDFAKSVYSREQFRQIFKHFTKTQFLKQEFQEGMPLDEFIYQPVKS